VNLENIFVIGDVHGMIHTLEKLINKLPKNSKIIFVGDLVDRGKYSKEVIEFVISNNYTSILGNHEYAMYKYFRESKYQEWIKKGWGGEVTIRSYENSDEVLENHLKWIDTLPLYLEIDNYFITHGFGLPYYKRKDNSIIPILFNRLEETTYQDDWEKYQNYKITNIFGHTPQNSTVKFISSFSPIWNKLIHQHFKVFIMMSL
jgi:serine/threonine protein phosphatase 1